MSNDKKPDDKPAAPPWYLTGPGGAKAIPVKSLRIPSASPNVMELPAPDAASRFVSDDGLIRNAAGVMVEKARNQPRNKIYYLPWLGMFAIESYRPGDGGLQMIAPVTMVPREWAHWTPLE